MKIKVIILETHMKTNKNDVTTTSGDDYCSTILPGKYLPDTKFEVEIRKEPFNKDKKKREEITKKRDIK